MAADGKIDRKVLGSKVFGKPDEMKRLTDIVWPGIRALALSELEDLAAGPADQPKVAVLEAAVMFEANWTDLCHTVWCTAVDPNVAVERLMARQPGMIDEEGARKRLASQMKNDERVERSDLMLWNKGSVDEICAQVGSAVRQTVPGMGGELDD